MMQQKLGISLWTNKREKMDKESKDLINHKIKTVKDLTKLLKKERKNNKVIMCHGTFDIVHPGHIRHLLFAKNKADILVVSLTADKHITKGNMRPFIPEEMRAFNLAALEVVDFVLIDQNETPIQNLKVLKPDYFAKGYEYGKNEIIQKTEEEIETLKNYGGEIIFTPGDIVYSSSKIITEKRPVIHLEKMLSIMEAEKVSFSCLRDALDKIKGLKAHVVGDTIVDSYTTCSMIGGMTKTPTMSVKYENKQDFLGGAGIVAKHLEAAGADVTFTTLLGEDELGDFVAKSLKKSKIKFKPIIDPNRPTTNKNAVVVNDYRLLKIDKLDNTAISGSILNNVKNNIESVETDLVMFSDFRHGIFNKSTIPILTKSIPKNTFKAADSQVASRWGNILEFYGFNLITPNEREARFSTGDQDSVIRPLAQEIMERSKCKTLILKCGESGLITYRSSNKTNPRAFFNLDSMVENLIDPVGAGDALLAYSSLVLKATNNELIASIIGNIAAGLECEKDGNWPISSNLIIEKIDYLEKQSRYSS